MRFNSVKEVLRNLWESMIDTGKSVEKCQDIVKKVINNSLTFTFHFIFSYSIPNWTTFEKKILIRYIVQKVIKWLMIVIPTRWFVSGWLVNIWIPGPTNQSWFFYHQERQFTGRSFSIVRACSRIIINMPSSPTSQKRFFKFTV